MSTFDEEPIELDVFDESDTEEFQDPSLTVTAKKKTNDDDDEVNDDVDDDNGEDDVDDIEDDSDDGSINEDEDEIIANTQSTQKNLFNIENASRQILNDIRGLLPDKPASQDIIKSLDNLLEDNGTADLRLAVTRIRGLLPAPPAPVVISPEVLEKLEKKGISSEEAKRRIRNMENPNFDDFDEEGKLSQKDMAIFNNFDVSGDDTIPVATVPVVRIEDAPAVVPSAARANIPNNELVSNLMDYLRESERPPVVTLSEEDKTKYKSDRSKYNNTRKDCKKCNNKHYLPVNCDKDGIKRKCVGYDVKDTTTRRTSNMNRDDRRQVVRAEIERLKQ